MTKKRIAPVGINALLHNEQVRRVQHEGQPLYAAVDVVAELSGSEEPAAYWADLKRQEPRLAQRGRDAEFPAIEGKPAAAEGLSIDGVMRLVQSVPSPRAERLKNWLAVSARQRLQEAENPE